VSGIVGIVNLDGSPVDRALLRRLTDFMSFRGPDAQHTWVNGMAGFGHTLLRTTEESDRDHQPFTSDGKVWIVAEARIDARADLIRQLEDRGECVEGGATDVELVLHAFRVWGDDCVDHLLGDFAFAVWDGPRRRLFCARDPLGVKPFFYAHVGGSVIFSNTQDCIRQHPAVSGKLNELAIGDFLLFGLNQDLTTTSFADIRRLPPAHRATWSTAGMRLSRYWTLPIEDPIYFKRAEDYTDRFKELLDVSVADRLRTNRISIFMSGGLDSPTLAATARRILRNRSTRSELHAFTTVIDGLDQNERYYAELVAVQLGIPIHFRDRTSRIIDRDWNERALHTPEPVANPTILASDREEYRSISACSRVLFYGEGPDNALTYEWKPYLAYLARKRKFGRLLTDVSGHVIRHKRIPLIPTIPRMLATRARRHRFHASYPDWLNPIFESRMQLRARWEDHAQHSSAPCHHPLRPLAYRSFYIPLWDRLFTSLDAGETGVPLETRHPFIDLRLLRFMLSVPAIPWCRSKYLVRRSMRGVLPDPILRRRKSPIPRDPSWEGTQHFGLPSFQPASGIHEYVNCEKVSRETVAHIGLFRVNFRPFTLNYWLTNLNCKEELENEPDRKRAASTRS
jgi:asparagine synthase (glutamine-hydrolysing)